MLSLSLSSFFLFSGLPRVSIEFKVLSLRRVSLLAYSPLAIGILFGKYFSTDGGPADAHLNLFQELTKPGLVAPYPHFHSPSLPVQRFQALSTINQTLLHKKTNSIETNHSGILSLDIVEGEDVGHPNITVSSSRTLVTDNRSWISDQAYLKFYI